MPPVFPGQLRLVLDTNTAVSGLLWNGTPARLIDLAETQRVQLYSSSTLIDELRSVIFREKFASRLKARNLAPELLVSGYAALVQLVELRAITPTILRDPADDVVLETALAAQADLIVSGDSDLLDLREFAGIPILPAAAAFQLMTRG